MNNYPRYQPGTTANPSASGVHYPTLPWYTAVLPLVVFQLGTQLSIHFTIAPGSSLWYLPIPLGIILVQWWGLRVAPALYLNALFSAGLRGLSRWYFWPIYAIPETVVVTLSWLLFRRLKHNPCQLSDLRQVLQFLLFGIFLPVTVGGFQGQMQLVLLDDLPIQQFVSVALTGWVADLFGCLAITLPVMVLFTPLMGARGLLIDAVPEDLPFQREPTPSPLQRLEALIIGAGLLLISLLLPVQHVWFLYGVGILWIALRLGVTLTLLANTWIICLVFLFPIIFSAKVGANWVFNSHLLNIQLALTCLFAAGIIVACAVGDRHESEHRYKQLTELISDYLFRLTVHPDGSVKMAWMSDNYSDITGRSQAEVQTPENWTNIVHPDDIGSLEQTLQRAITTGDPVELECRSFLKSGAQRWIHIVARAEWDTARQRPAAILGAVRDITDRKMAEAATKESEAQFWTMFDAAHDGILLIDPEEQRFFLGNVAICQMLGYPHNELLRLTVLDIHPPEALPEVLWHFDQMNRGEEQIARDIPVQRKDGSRFYADISAALMSLHGKTYLMGIFRDITERQRTEQALRQAQKDWEEIFQAVGQPTLILDPQYNILAANRAAVQTTGKCEEELKTQKCFELFHLSNENPGLCPMQQLLDSDQIEIAEMEMEALHGIFLVSCTPVHDDQGHLEKIIHIATDITALKHAEAQVKQLNAELEQRVEQRTTELQAANRELKDFAYSVSHDLKAPLRAISRLAQWLVDDYTTAFDEHGKEMVTTLIGRVKRMDDLIEGILEYSRIGRVHSEHVTLDLNRLVYEVIDSLGPPPHVQITVARALPTITADKTRMIQVFQNLIGNAIKFLDKPSGLIRIDCTNEKTFWKFSVTDNGPGIDPKYHVQIFQMFQTLHARDEVESTGIGLALVKKLSNYMAAQWGYAPCPARGVSFSSLCPKSRCKNFMDKPARKIISG